MSRGGSSGITDRLLALVPEDGTAIGNEKLRRLLSEALKRKVGETEYTAARDGLIEAKVLVRGQGRGGSVRRAVSAAAAAIPELVLAAKEVKDDPRPAGREVAAPSVKRGAAGANEAPQVISYRHKDRRKNNPEVGMVKPETDPEEGRTRYAYDPHLDPALQFDVGRAQVERLIDDALASGDEKTMREALAELRRLQQPYLNWSGKAERTSFDIDLVSLHVHERIDPASILAAVRKRLRGEKGAPVLQSDLFAAPFENLPLRDAIDFYKHERGWANRLIAGDSLLVMNSLLQKEGMAGQVQMIYIDPPYGIKYGSNFQPFVNRRDVKDRRDEDLTQEPEMIKAFRDTWELGIHSYLAYLRDRLLLAKELLHESGSVFVQISDENLHHVREVLDDVFGSGCFVAVIPVVKTAGLGATGLARVCDYLLWYTRSSGPSVQKYRQLYLPREAGDDGAEQYSYAVERDGRRRRLSITERSSPAEIASETRVYRLDNLTSGAFRENTTVDYWFRGVRFHPGNDKCWKSTVEGLTRLTHASRVAVAGNTLAYVRFIDDFPVRPIKALWTDTGTGGFGDDKLYVVQTTQKIIERCMLMCTDPGDLVLDPTCGSGTTAFVAEKWGRRWITCDTSRVAVTLAKQRLMTASYDYYELKYPHEGLKGGFIYRTVPHVTLKSIANNPEIDEIWERMHPAIAEALAALNESLREHPPAEAFAITEGGRKGQSLDFAKKSAALEEWEVPFDFPEGWPAKSREAFDAFHAARQAMQKRMDQSIAAHADQEQLFDQPAVSKSKLRITGPFTVEAVPFPSVLALEESEKPREADAAIARSGASSRHHQWRDELVKTGIRGRGGQILKFAELEALPDTRYLNYVGVVADTSERVVVSFGPEHAALEQRQVALALNEAEKLRPAPKFIIFAAFTFDPEAAKDIDETRWPGVQLLKAQMNTDLLTEDLKKARASNQSFWLMGQPDVEVRRRKDGTYEVEVNGFDYFDTAKGELVSGGKSKIAMWLLDTDYDERSLFPRQVFFPMAGKADGWQRLKRDIKAELNEELLQKYHGTVSLPFAAGDFRKIAVKIVDDRGIESLKILELDRT